MSSQSAAPSPAPSLAYVTNLIPPVLFAALEIESDANLIALYWEPAGDEATWYDGHIGADCNWWAYQIFFDHPLIIAALAELRLTRFVLGSSDSPATHWAIIDRAQNHLYIAPRADAERIIQAQWPPIDPAEIARTQAMLTQIDWSQFRRTLAQILANAPTPDLSELQKRHAERQHNCDLLKTWLDQRLGSPVFSPAIDDANAWLFNPYAAAAPVLEAEP